MSGRALLALTMTVGMSLGLVAPRTAGVGPAADDRKHPIHWASCDGEHGLGDAETLDDADCGTLEVPVDHFHPGAKLELSILRVPASGRKSERIGALFVNPGGPGATARGLANRMGHVLPRAIRRHFDVVGVDPRGTGASELDCGYDPADLIGADPMVKDYADVDGLVRVNQAFVAACQHEAGDLLAHLGTRDAARDIDAVRAAMGDEQISYLGFGYGTVLGQTYARLFPDRVRAMVLDGAVALGPSGPELAHAQALAFERALGAFAEHCNAQPDCPASPDALGAVTELMARTQATPVPAEPRDLGIGELETGLASPLDDRSRWHDLATAVEAALLGNGTRLVKLADDYIDDTNVDLRYAVDCLDYAWPTGPGGPSMLLAASAATEAEAPHFGQPVTNQYLPCTLWPVPADPLTARPEPMTPTPLVVATTGDATRPYQQGVEVARQLGAVLLTHRGGGHTVVGQGLACVDAAVAAYLVHVQLPPRGTTCADP